MDDYRPNELEWLPYDLNYIRENVPPKPGLYELSCPNGRVIYVGMSESSVRSRLETYGAVGCHNKWIRSYFRGRGVVWSAGIRPLDLYFTYWLTNRPAFWEAQTIQRYRLASGG